MIRRVRQCGRITSWNPSLSVLRFAAEDGTAPHNSEVPVSSNRRWCICSTGSCHVQIFSLSNILEDSEAVEADSENSVIVEFDSPCQAVFISAAHGAEQELAVCLEDGSVQRIDLSPCLRRSGYIPKRSLSSPHLSPPHKKLKSDIQTSSEPDIVSLLDDEDDSFLTFSPRTTACFVNYESPVDLLGDDSSEEMVTDLPPRRDINIPTISESPIASGIQNTVIKPHHVSTFWFQRRNAESSTVISAVQVQSLLIIQSINQKGQQDGRINVDIYKCSGEPSSSNVQLISSHQIASQRQSATRDHSPVTFPCPLLILSHKEGEKIDSCEISHSISPNLYNQLFGSPYSERRVPMLLIGCPSGSLSYAPLDEVVTPSCNILSRILCSDTSTITGIHCASMNSVATVDTLIVSFQSGKLQVLIASKRDGKMNSLIIATDNIGCQIYLSTTLNHHSIILCNYQNTKVIRLHHLRKYLSDQTINKPDLPINHILAKDLQDITDLELTTVLRMQNLSDSTFLALNRLGFVAYCDMEQPKIKPLPTCAFDNTEDCKGKLQLFAKMERDLEASSVQMKEVDDSLMQLNYAVQVIKTVEPNSSQSPFAVKDIEICDNLRPRNFSLQAILSYQGQKELGAGWSVMASAGIHITHATSVSNILCVTEGCCTKETSYCSQYATQSLAGGVSNSLFYVTLDLPLNWSLHNLLISFSLTYDTSVPAALVGVRSTKLTALLHRQILSPVDFLQPLSPFVHLPAPLSVTGVKADSFPTGLSSSEPQESLNLSIKEEALRQCLKCSQLVGSDPLKSFLSLILKKNCLSLLKTLEDGQFLLQCALPGSNPVRLVLKEAVEKDLELTVQSSSFLVAAAMVNAIVNRMVQCADPQPKGGVVQELQSLEKELPVLLKTLNQDTNQRNRAEVQAKLHRVIISMVYAKLLAI